MNGEKDWLLFMGRGDTNQEGGRGVSDVLPLPKGGWVGHAEGGWQKKFWGSFSVKA